MNNELYHYGIVGMKWGIRKDRYKTMSGKQKRATRNNYYNTSEGQQNLKSTKRATTIGTLLGGPLVGIASGLIANSIMNRKVNELNATKSVSDGEKVVNESSNKKVSELTRSGKTESKRVADIKKRLIGKDSDGKPAFLMSEKELDDFTKQYETRREVVKKRFRNASDNATKERIRKELDQMENDYLSIVEQDFWYSDD